MQTAFNVQTEELPFIEAKELYEGHIGFQVEKIFIKNNVVTKFGTKDVAYVTIRIADLKYVLSVKQDVLFKCFAGMKDAIDTDSNPYPEDATYYVDIPNGKAYYVLMVDA